MCRPDFKILAINLEVLYVVQNKRITSMPHGGPSQVTSSRSLPSAGSSATSCGLLPQSPWPLCKPALVFLSCTHPVGWLSQVEDLLAALAWTGFGSKEAKMKGSGNDPEEQQQGLFRPKENFQRSVLLHGEGTRPTQERSDPGRWRAKRHFEKQPLLGFALIIRIQNTKHH